MISDVNDFLAEITRENEAPFLYEKIGNQYQHFLIDEFQDTSEFQWSSFKPLLENSLASGYTNLLVGDVKAVYISLAWRQVGIATFGSSKPDTSRFCRS